MPGSEVATISPEYDVFYRPPIISSTGSNQKGTLVIRSLGTYSAGTLSQRTAAADNTHYPVLLEDYRSCGSAFLACCDAYGEVTCSSHPSTACSHFFPTPTLH